MAISESLMQRIAAAKQRNASGSKYAKLETNKTLRFYVIPGEFSVDKLFYFRTAIHYLGDKENILCPKETFGDECPICAFRIELREQVSAVKRDIEDMKGAGASGAEIQAKTTEMEALDEFAKKLWPSTRYLLNILPVGESSAKIFNAPKTVFSYIWDLYEKNAASGIDIIDVNRSYQFSVTKTGKGKNNTEYKCEVLLAPLPIVHLPGKPQEPDVEAIAKVMAERYNLEQEITKPTTDELQKMFEKFMGTQGAESESRAPAPHHEDLGSGPETAPTPPPPTPAPTAAPVAAPSVTPTPAATGITAAAALQQRLAALRQKK